MGLSASSGRWGPLIKDAASKVESFLDRFEAAVETGNLSEARRLLNEAHRTVLNSDMSAGDRMNAYKVLSERRRRLKSVRLRDPVGASSTRAGVKRSRRPSDAQAVTKICSLCGRFFTPPDTNPRRRRCKSCYSGTGSTSVRAASGGLPTLGKRR